MTNYTDKEQIEIIKKWWNDQGKTLAIVVLVGLVIGFGWRYWHQREAHNAEVASQLYQTMLVAEASQQTKLVQAYQKQLRDHYTHTPYATLAVLSAAKHSVKKNKLKTALQELNWVVQHGKTDSFKQLARIRAARVQIALKQASAALTTLQTVNDKTYQPLIDQVKGEAYQALGRTAEAHKAYEKAQHGYKALGAPNPILRMMMAS